MSLIDSASLIVTPNAYKEGKLYSVIPSDGSGDLSVTRATTATRVNSQGLVELVPYNLVQYSEQLDNSSAWAAFSGTTLTANAATAPDGTMTADRIQGASGGFRGVRQSIALDTTTCTLSVYLKSATGANQNARIWIDATSQVVALTTEWQRFTLTALPTTSTFDVTISTAIGASIDVYAWGAQLVEGSVAKDYQKTETRLNIPRLDYSNGTCPSILVEPQRTNLVTYSSSFDNAAWQKENASVTANTTTSPDGTQNADSLIENGSNDSHLIYQGGTLSAASYSASVFIKKNTRQYAFLQIATDGAANRYTIVVDLNNGTMTASSTSGSPSGTSYKIDSMGDGWYRLSVTATHTSAQVYSVFGLSNSGTPTFNSVAIPIYSGNGTSGVYVWGAQLEAGSYATSYIPTTSASVTRNADVISKTGISSLIGQTEGTLFQDIYIDDILNAGSYYSFLAIGTTGNLMFMTFYPDGRIQFAMFNGNVLQVNIDAPSYGLTTGRHKMAVAYKNNDFAFYCDGNLVGTANSGSVPATSKIDLTDTIGGKQRYNAAVLWKTRLTNDELERLTGVGFNTYTEMANYYNYITQ